MKTRQLIVFCNAMKLMLVTLVALGVWATPTLAQPTITQQPLDQLVTNGGAAVFTVSVSGTGPFTYQWQFNGTNLPNNLITTVAGNGAFGFTGDGGQATEAELSAPLGLTFDSKGRLYIAGNLSNQIKIVDTNGIITSLAISNSTLKWPAGVAFDRTGNLLIDDQGNSRVLKVDTNGTISMIGELFWDPSRVAADGAGNVYVSDTDADLIYKVATNGKVTTVLRGLNLPVGVTFDRWGNLFVSDMVNNRVLRVATNGVVTTVAGKGPAGLGLFSGDGGLATNANLNFPQDLVCDAAGDFFISDTKNYRVRKVDTNGIITTVAGGGSWGYSGDGGPATNALLTLPLGLAIDAAGDLLLSDSENNRVREVHLAGDPTLALADVSGANAGNYSVVITSPVGSVTSSVAALNIPAYFITEPQNQTVTVGSNVSLPAVAGGSSPITYQWYFGGTPLLLSNTSTLKLTSVVPSNAGGYFLVASNSFGVATSSVLALTVCLPPLNFVPGFANGQSGNPQQLTAQTSGPPGYLYILQAASNLSPPVSWQSLLTNVADSNGNWSFTITNLMSMPGQFYRTVGQ